MRALGFDEASRVSVSVFFLCGLSRVSEGLRKSLSRALKRVFVRSSRV